MSFDDSSRDGEERKDLTNFGLKTDIYAKKSQKVGSSSEPLITRGISGLTDIILCNYMGESFQDQS